VTTSKIESASCKIAPQTKLYVLRTNCKENTPSVIQRRCISNGWKRIECCFGNPAAMRVECGRVRRGVAFGRAIDGARNRVGSINRVDRVRNIALL
jgi:hypothetical protein